MNNERNVCVAREKADCYDMYFVFYFSVVEIFARLVSVSGLNSFIIVSVMGIFDDILF